tara:strand:- start:1661 stop:2257 length:597 start_codon:yes stop_codon:yes gene_type:complete
MHLYLDTSHFLSIGLLNTELEWIHFDHDQKLQHSADIHAKIYQILESNNAEALNLSSVIICNGPGSYTGIRLGEGIAQLFELSQVPVYSFHQYEIPKILGYQIGHWVCHAFKKEVFNYIWKNEEVQDSLVTASDWASQSEHVFSHQPEGPWQSSDFLLTTELVQKQPKQIFEYIIGNKIRRESYYFRPLDKEFKRSVV